MIIDQNTRDTKKFIWQGLYLDALRGFDATGLATVDVKGAITINKKAMPSNDFLQLTPVDDQIEGWNNRVFIGHNRLATKGAVNNINSHPFQHDHITMVHNGSLTHLNKLPENHRFDVDSDNLAHMLSTIGVYETLKIIQGAFALVWYDELEEKVFMVRNNQRPLHYATVKDKNIVMYASEKIMLEFLMKRNGFTPEEVNLLPVGKLLSFDPKSKDISKYISEDVELYKEPNQSNNCYGGTKRNNANSFQQGGYEKGKENSSSKKKEGKGKEKTSGETRIANINRMFEDAGIKKGDRLSCCMYSFTNYKTGNTDRGIWEGSTIEEPYLTVMAYGATEADFEVGEVYSMEALSMQVTRVSNSPIVIKEERVIVDEQSKILENYENESSDNNNSEEYAETSIILAGETEHPTLAEEVAAYKEGISLVGKTRSEIKRSIQERREKKPIIALPYSNKADTGSEDLIYPNPENDILDETETGNVDFVYLVGPRGTTIPKHEFDSLTKHGCSSCTGNIFPEDAESMEWWGSDNTNPICPSCVEEFYKLAEQDKGRRH